MNIRLVKLDYSYKQLLEDMLEEWIKDIQINQTNDSPYVIFRDDYHDFDYYMNHLDTKDGEVEGWVANHVLFCLDEDRHIFVGAVDIRHSLNDHLYHYGGHIGDGIRPSERGKGYATAMIALALEECRTMGFERILMVCDRNNIASAKTIIKNGGILENEEIFGEEICQRYWIQL